MMLPVVLGIAAIAALFKCNSEDDNAKPAYVPPPPKPETRSSGDTYISPPDLKYKKSCLMSDNSFCTAEDYLASMVDYTGAIYGDGGSFDGKLKPGEIDYVERLFGSISGNSSEAVIDWYFGAQKTVLQREGYILTEHNYSLCNKPDEFVVQIAQDPGLGEAYAIGGVHDCFSTYQGLLFFLGWEGLFAQNPDEWLFLVEGSAQSTTQEGESAIKSNETALYDYIANKLGIPIFDPIVPIDDERVIVEMEKQGYNRKGIAACAFYSQQSMIIDSDPGFQDIKNNYSDDEVRVIFYAAFQQYFSGKINNFDPIFQTVADAFGVREEELKAYCRTMWHEREPEDVIAFLKEINGDTEKVFNEAVKISNELSAPRVRKLVGDNGKSKTFFQVGSSHLPIVSDVYKDVTTIELEH